MTMTSGSVSWLFKSDSANTGIGNLLDIALGRANRITSYSGTDSIQNLRLAIRDRTKNIAESANEPTVKRDIAAFRSGVNKAGSVDNLLSNPAVMKVLLRANGLGDQESYGALARKALMSNLADERSLANQLTDRRWKNVAQIYDFAAKGLSILRDPKVLDTLEYAYAEVTWRKELNKTTPGLSDALAFREQASSVKSDLHILGDPILRRVVTTVLGLPLEIALQSLEAQQKAITSRLNIKQFQDPKFVENFTQRYLLAAANKSTQSAGSVQGLSVSSISTELVV